MEGEEDGGRGEVCFHIENERKRYKMSVKLNKRGGVFQEPNRENRFIL